MKVKFRHSEINKEHPVECEANEYYILQAHPNNWSTDCRVAVKKSAVDVVTEQTYRIGQRFRVGYNKGEYILAATGIDIVTLINLKDGNRWTEPRKVRNAGAITKAELDCLADDYELICECK